MNNTLSPRQVYSMCNEIDSIASEAKVRIEEAMYNFNTFLSKTWEDDDAVDFAKKVSNSMNGVIESLANNSNSIKNGIVDVANMYAKQAHKPLMNSSRITFYSAINPSVVKTTFDDGETYGFKDDNSSGRVTEEFEKLVTKCNKINTQLTEDLSSINAFGNPEVKAVINHVSNLIGKALNASVYDIKQFASDKIYHVASSYKRISENAVSAIDSIVTENNVIEGHGGIFR